MINTKYIGLLLVYCLALMLIGTIAHAYMTAPLVIHWNAQGQADGYGSTFTAIYLFPLIILAAGLLIVALPNIDPLRANVMGFRDSLYIFVAAFAAFMGYIYLLTLAWNLGYRFEMNRLMLPAFAIFFYCAGLLMGRAKRNFFIGIRTPWTLSSDLVWDRTHALAARAFKISAFISLLGILFPSFAVFFMIGPLLVSTALVLVYSYLEYRRVTQSS